VNAIIRATAVDLAAKIKSRELSSVEVTRAHLQRIEEVDPAVHAFL
jgi:aspartyl-tRNA(Asn)/glutamyl-tRNA(Gln) amidotransferase subunit A